MISLPLLALWRNSPTSSKIGRKVRCSPLNFPCSLLLRAANDGELPRYLDEKLLLRPLLLHRHVARGHSGRPWEGRCLWLGVEGESSAGLVRRLERWRPYRRVWCDSSFLASLEL